MNEISNLLFDWSIVHRVGHYLKNVFWFFFWILKLRESVLVSWGCHNKLSQTGWLKTTEIYYLRASCARSLKLKCQQGHDSSDSSWGEPFFASCSFGGPGHLAWGSITPVLTFMTFSLLSFSRRLKGHLSLDLDLIPRSLI